MRVGVAALLVAACGASTPPRVAMRPADGKAISLPSPTNDRPLLGPKGLLGGQSFKTISMYAFFDWNELHLGFSSEPNACVMGAEGVAHGGETRVTLQHLTSIEETPPEVGKLYTYSASWGRADRQCVVGDDGFWEASSAYDSSQGNATIMVTKLGPDTVDGELDIVFSDGSRITGQFVAPVCTQKYSYEVAACR